MGKAWEVTFVNGSGKYCKCLRGLLLFLLTLNLREFIFDCKIEGGI